MSDHPNMHDLHVPSEPPSAPEMLPSDAFTGSLIGRVHIPAKLTGTVPGPAPVLVREEGVFDLSPLAPTVAQLVMRLEACRPSFAGTRRLKRIGDYRAIMDRTLEQARCDKAAVDEAVFLTPIDLQAIKACGVTFVVSLLERVIEEKAGGDPGIAGSVRARLEKNLGGELRDIVPGSPAAMQLKEALLAEDLWSPYLEVGIGPDAEVFTKAQPLSAVGPGAEVGLHPDSLWNNPEPEIVLIIDPAGQVVGATLGNDVNLRDIEGRSALLLGKAKDNNASCAIGPFIRLFDDSFSLDDVRRAEVRLRIEGTDGFVLEDSSRMGEISRDPLQLVKQTIGPHHQYPDGLALFTGTLFAPSQDRDAEGAGFTHKIGDRVSIRADELGTLFNTVTTSDRAAPWKLGISALMNSLSSRGLLGRPYSMES